MKRHDAFNPPSRPVAVLEPNSEKPGALARLLQEGDRRYLEQVDAPKAAPLPAAGLPPAAAKPGRVSFGKAKVKKEETKTAYPVFPDPNGQVAIIAGRIKARKDELDALAGALATDKAELRMLISPFYFTTNQGKAEVPSSISVVSKVLDFDNEKEIEGEVLVSFTNRYAALASDDPITAIIGAELAAKYFQQAFELKIKGDAMPADKAQAVVDELLAVLERHGVSDAMEIKDQLKPVRDFHTARHTAFTPETNLALEEACPCVAMVKTRGRGEKS